MQPYSKYVTTFREDAAKTGIFEYKSGLNYVFRNLLSGIPAAIGHLVDTMLNLDGLILNDRDSHFSGPFGLLFGLPFWILGAITGQILQTVLSLPGCIAYYLLDKPLSFLIKDFDKIMPGNLKTENLIIGTLLNILTTLYRGYVYLTQGTPNEMQGLFGFIGGLVPQTVSYIVTRFSATTVSVTRFLTDGACEGIRTLYSKIKYAASTPDLTPGPAPESAPAPEMKRRRIRRPAGKDNVVNEVTDELHRAISSKIDLFAALGITLQQYEQASLDVNKIWRNRTVSCHPDKYPEKKQEWDNLELAKTILIDPKSNQAKEYLKWYQSTMNVPPIANNLASFYKSSQTASQPVVTPAENHQDRDSVRRVITRKKK